MRSIISAGAKKGPKGSKEKEDHSMKVNGFSMYDLKACNHLAATAPSTTR